MTDTSANTRYYPKSGVREILPCIRKSNHDMLWNPFNMTAWQFRKIQKEQRSGWKVVNLQPQSGEIKLNWRVESKPNTQLVVLTAPELVGGVKVGEERVKLIRTEERVAAGLHAAGSGYARDYGSLEIEGWRVQVRGWGRVGSFRVSNMSRG